MKIGELARRTGTTTKAIRYYEDIGLLPEPDRAPNGYRSYDDDALDRLTFVKDAQATGLTLDEIASIIGLRSQGESTCDHVIELLSRHLGAIDEQIRTLRMTRSQLASLLDRARRLDPGDCVDALRCQTIVRPSDARAGSGVSSVEHAHRTPGGHVH
jgi:DNA-binding transcriptional MerR regulator